MFKKFFRQKGQSLVFFAIALPTLFMFVGAAADFGWLYLNQSRLQNAADAAVNAGAAVLIEDEQALSDYTYTTFVANSDEGLQKLISEKTISPRNNTTKLYYDLSKKKFLENTGKDADATAKKYAKENLDSWLGENVEWTDTKSDAQNKVQFQKILYGKNVEDYSALYYTVILSEENKHLFSIMDNLGFEPLQSKVMAAVKITHVPERTNFGEGSNPLYYQMKAVEVAETYPNWDEINIEKGNSTEADMRSVLTCGNYYKADNNFKTELSLMNGWAFKVGSGNQGKPVRADEKYKHTKLDDLFIDYQAELGSASKKKDLDLKNFDVSYGSFSWLYGDTPKDKYYKEIKNFHRIHVPIEIADVYPISTHNAGNTVQREAPDPLYAFIEQETLAVGEYTNSNGKTSSRNGMNSVRQLMINVNINNTQKDEYGEYINRPIVFFYEGPEKADEKDVDAGGKHLRDSKPVILSLFTDFRGIIFAPQSPICINGNGHKWEGFAVGSDFCRLKERKEVAEVKYDEENSTGEKTAFVNLNLLNKLVSEGVQHDCNKVVKWNDKDYYVNEAHLCSIDAEDYDKYQYPYTVEINGEKFGLDSVYNLREYKKENKNTDIDIKVEVTNDEDNKESKIGKKYYIPESVLLAKVTEEKVTFINGTTIDLSPNVVNFNGKTSITYDTNTKTVTSQVQPMFVDKRGEVQFAELEDVVNSDDSTTFVKVPRLDENNLQYIESETVLEKPLYIDNDAKDPHYYNYKIFNLDPASRYNSFMLVKLPNYGYLAQNDLKGNTSRDMFFTTPRSKWVD